jgi:hypothetical protein
MSSAGVGAMAEDREAVRLDQVLISWKVSMMAVGFCQAIVFYTN